MISELSIQSAVWLGLSGIAGGIAICVLANLLPLISPRLRRKRQPASDSSANSDFRRLTILAASVQDTIVEFDEKGTILFLSDNLLDVTGRQPSQLIGLSISDFASFLADTPVEKSLRETGTITPEAVAATDQPQTSQFTRSDGSKRFFESTATTYRNSDGALRILTCTRDVTDRIEQAERIRQSESRLRRAERIANLGSWDYYPYEAKLFWSDQMCRLHGLVPHEGQMDLDLVRSLINADDFHDLMKAALRDQEPHESRYRIHRFDNGETRTLLTRAETKRDELGKIVRISGSSMDITDQLALENRLRRGQKYFRALVEANIVGVLFTEQDGRIIEANDAFLSLLGYSNDDVPLIWEDLTSPHLIARDQSAREELQKTGVVLPYEKEFISKSGEPVLMLIASARIDLDTAMVIAIDLSERQRAEAYISEYQKVLERTIAERTQELMESRDRLIENDRLAAVGTLAAGVAHQINNPIGAILNSAEFAMLCREEGDAEAIFEQALQVNLTEARRCAQIVKSMLLFSRDEPTPRWQEDLRGVIGRADRAIAPYAADRSAHVVVQIDPKPILALISPIEIEQAIVNVLRNAIESHEKGASISLSLFTQDKNAIIEVIDDGRGIPEHERDRLFEPFFSTRTREGGTGLGLSVAHGILTDHGGEIRIESILGGGTRIVMSLPIV